ncbi:MAG: hypothetical protein ABEJ03_04890, partial [Candidatus Nanohaloarchaea archaeon]
MRDKMYELDLMERDHEEYFLRIENEESDKRGVITVYADGETTESLEKLAGWLSGETELRELDADEVTGEYLRELGRMEVHRFLAGEGFLYHDEGSVSPKTPDLDGFDPADAHETGPDTGSGGNLHERLGYMAEGGGSTHEQESGPEDRLVDDEEDAPE